MILVWTRHNDGKDRLQRFVVVLEDNFPGEQWAYLITVYTGFWIGAGTDANIGFRLYGSKGMSRVHNLQSRQRKVLKTNCDDWFLIFTQHSLGEIQKIHVFQDHTGGNPDWYCSYIMVYDLEDQKDFKFVVGKWMSLVEEDEFVEWIFTPTPTLKSLRRDRIAMDNVIFGLRETHLIISIFTRHPRSSVTRSQRLSICVCMQLVHMLTSIMFFKLEELEYEHYSSKKQELIMEIESYILSTPFTFILIFCFKKSRIVSGPKSTIPMTLTSTQAVPLESGIRENQATKIVETKHNRLTEVLDRKSSSSLSDTSEEEEEEEEEVEEEEYVESEEVEQNCWKNCYQQITALLFQVITSKSVMPVKIAEEDEESSIVRKQWMYFAWFVCETAIVGSGFFIVLYSMKLDNKKNNDWLENRFWFSLKNNFLAAPMKIIIFSTILAILYGQLQYIPSFECNTESAMNMEFLGNKKFLTKVVNIRRRKYYRPLNNKEKYKIFLIEKNWRRWRLCINFAVVILLWLVVSCEVMATWSGEYDTTFKHIEHLFKPMTKNTDFISFREYSDYLKTVLIPMLDKRKWYIDRSCVPENVWHQEMGYVSDYSFRVVGLPRLRQQRVQPDSCTFPDFMNGIFSQCNAQLNWGNIDKKNYDTRWTPERLKTLNPNSSWVFRPSQSPLLLCGLNTRKCYIQGGYQAILSYDGSISEETINSLVAFEWFDSLTRVVFFETIIYSAYANFICYVASMLERLADGSFHLSVKSEVLHPLSSSFTATLVFLFTFMFYYMVRVILLFNRQGLKYLVSWTGLLDIFLNVLLYATITSFFFYNDARSSYLKVWNQGEQEDLLMPTGIFLHRDAIRYETAVLLIISPAQVLHNFRFGKQNFIMFRKITRSLHDLYVLGLISVMFWVAYKLFGYINSYTFVIVSFNRLFNVINYQQSGIFTSPMLEFNTASIIFTLIISVLSLFACISVIYSFNETKVRYKNSKDFNMFIFLYDKLKYARKRIHKMRRNLAIFGHIFAHKRFRAGADEGMSLYDEDVYQRNKSFSEAKLMGSDLNLKCDVILKKLKILEESL